MNLFFSWPLFEGKISLVFIRCEGCFSRTIPLDETERDRERAGKILIFRSALMNFSNKEKEGVCSAASED